MGRKLLKGYSKLGAYAILIAIILLFTLHPTSGPTFIKVSNIWNIVRQVSIYGIVVTGITFVMISGGADLSVGGQLACNGLLVAALMTKLNVPVWAAILICLLSGVLLGAYNGYISAILKVTPFVITLTSMLILNGVASVVTKGLPIYSMPESFLWMGQGNIFGDVPASALILIAVLAVGWFLLNKTYFGRSVYALGGNQEAARLAGINVVKVRVLVYAICGLFTAIGCMVMVARTNTASPTAGASYPFDCMTAACLGGITFGGGTGNLLKSFTGVLIIGILANGLLLIGVDTNVQQVIKGALLLFAIAMDALQKKYTVAT